MKKHFKNKKPKRSNATTTTNTRYQIKTWKPFGYSTGTGLPALNNTPNTNFDLISFLDDDTNFSNFVQGQYEYIRIKSVTIRYIPGKPTEINDLDIGTFICAGVFGRPSTASWSVEAIDQLKSSVIFNSTKPFTRKYFNQDKNYYIANELTGSVRPHLRFVVNKFFPPTYEDFKMGIMQFSINVEAKGRMY
jgi:hypothetical protein